MVRKKARANVTPVRQRTQFSCMAASMTMALQALGVRCSEDEVAEVMGVAPMRGATWEDAVAAAQHYGCIATLVCPSTIEQIKRWTDNGDPVLIAWNPEGREWSHASVVFDVEEDMTCHVADPNIPDPQETVRIVDRKHFYSKWSEKWPRYLVRRPAMCISREITIDGHQTRQASMRKVSMQDVAKVLKKLKAPGKTDILSLGADEIEKVWTIEDWEESGSISISVSVNDWGGSDYDVVVMGSTSDGRHSRFWYQDNFPIDKPVDPRSAFRKIQRSLDKAVRKQPRTASSADRFKVLEECRRHIEPLSLARRIVLDMPPSEVLSVFDKMNTDHALYLNLSQKPLSVFLDLHKMMDVDIILDELARNSDDEAFIDVCETLLAHELSESTGMPDGISLEAMERDLSTPTKLSAQDYSSLLADTVHPKESVPKKAKKKKAEPVRRQRITSTLKEKPVRRQRLTAGLSTEEILEKATTVKVAAKVTPELFLRRFRDMQPDEAEEIVSAIKGAKSTSKVQEALAVFDEIADGFGVETISGEDLGDRYYQDVVAFYVNMGDQYSLTLFFDVDENAFQLTDWSTWVKEFENQGGTLKSAGWIAEDESLIEWV